MSRLAACGLLIFLAMMTAARAEGPSVTVADPFLELRTGPGRGYPVFHVVERGETVRVDARRTDWFQVVDAGGREGWVHKAQMAETLLPAGVKLEFDDPAREDFGTHRREAGLLLGDYGGANVVTVYGAWAFNEHLAAELALSHILGNFSDGQYVTIGVTHVPLPEWRIQPFLSIGTGVIRIEPEGTLVGSDIRTDQVAYAGIGVRAYIARRFIVRGEVKEYVVFTDRDENEEDTEWKIGFAFFF
ncbi:MAG TPA: SH3 domain-containing protein [Steroidobacteraceae bacterium]|nr:SH3 domain-containing protein [Steroidobacteraceae bacterium]